MAKYLVCRTFAERWRWIVEAPDKESALAMLDGEDDKAPDGHTLESEKADKEWLGPTNGFTMSELEDDALEMLE